MVINKNISKAPKVSLFHSFAPIIQNIKGASTMRIYFFVVILIFIISCSSNQKQPADSSAENICQEENLQSDPQNCGQCGNNCGGGECIAGICQPFVIASEQLFPCAVVADETGVYWSVQNTDKTDGQIRYWRSLDGSTGRLAQNFNAPFALALDDQYIYWTTNETLATVQRVPKTGGTSEIIAKDEDQTDQNFPRQLVVNANAVFWVDFKTSELVRWTKSDKQMTVIANPPAPSNLGLIEDSLFVVSQGTKSLLEYSVDGGEPTEIATWDCDQSIFGCSGGATTFGQNMFWSLTMKEATNGAIYFYSKSTDTASVLIEEQKNPVNLASDEEHLFWVNLGTGDNSFTDGELKMINFSDKKVTTLADNQLQPCGVTLYDGFVYWTTVKGGKVQRLKIPPK